MSEYERIAHLLEQPSPFPEEGFEVAVTIHEQDDLIAAAIAIKQATERGGYDPDSQLSTMLQGAKCRYLYSTVGMSQERHDKRIQEGTALGQFA